MYKTSTEGVPDLGGEEGLSGAERASSQARL